MENNVSGNRLMLVLLFLVSLVAVVAIIVAAVSLTNSDSDTPSINVNSLPGASSSGGSGGAPIIINTGSGGSGSSNSGSGDRIFKIRVGHTASRGHSFLDETGYVSGFIPDLINGVCEIGGMNCVTIWDEGENCWTTDANGEHGRGGIGLFNGWYDACIGQAITVNRVQVFDFSLPYSKQKSYHFYILNSNNDFHASDITGKKIGFRSRLSADAPCVARHDEIKGNIIPDENKKTYADRESAFNALRSGEVDALFGTTNTYAAYADQVKPAAGPAISCSLGGNGLMTRKDNDFNSYWNRAFQKFKDSGKFRKLCEQAHNVDYADMGGIGACVDAP